MIVTPTSSGWRIVYHRSHALLAAQIALEWDNKDRIFRIAETIAAIAQHDDLEREFEGYHLTEAGAPMDFTQRPQEAQSEIPRWKDLITTALYRSRWVALLSAKHVRFLTAEERDRQPELDRFVRALERQMQTWSQDLAIDEDEVEAAYAFMQWCDRLSLILVQEQLPEKERWLEISEGPNKVRYDIRQRSDDQTLEVSPWPFRTEAFTITVDARSLNQLRFASNDRLQDALARAPVETISWTFRR